MSFAMLALAAIVTAGGRPALAATPAQNSAAATNPARTSLERVEAFRRLPNWSGMWEPVGSPQTLDANVPRGLVQGQARDYPPLTPEWERRYSESFAKARDQAETFINPYRKYCASGFPNMMVSPWQFEFAITPEQTWIITNDRELRHIYTDGRPHPSDDDLWPTFWGHSIGHWEGRTLVIDTVAIKPELWVDQSSLVFSAQLHVVERLRMLDRNSLELAMTLTDPLALARPWVLIRQFRRVTGGLDWMTDTVCQENERDPVVNGRLTTGAQSPAR